MPVLSGWSTTTNYNSIHVTIKRYALFIYNLLKFDSFLDLICSDLNWFFSNYQYRLDVLKLAYKVYSNIGPSYFRDYICANIIETTRTRHRAYQIPALRIDSVGRNSLIII
jgi:hypothetical protein